MGLVSLIECPRNKAKAPRTISVHVEVAEKILRKNTAKKVLWKLVDNSGYKFSEGSLIKIPVKVAKPKEVKEELKDK